MKNLQKMGGIAALIGAATNLLALGVFVTLLATQRFRFQTIQARSWLFLRTTRLSCAYGTKSSFWSSACV